MSDNAKELIFEEDAREALRKGISELTEVVGVTLGPKGRYVGLDASWGRRKSPTMEIASLKMLSSKINMRTWALRLPKKWPLK